MSEPVQQEKPEQAEDAQMNPEELYREEIYTDRKIGVIRALIPIHVSGEFDDRRPVIYTGTKIIHRLDKFTITKILNVTENYKNHGESTHCIYICKSFCKYFH